MSASTESAALAHLMRALSPYRGDVVLIGGWAHRLSRLHPLAQPLDFKPLSTLDVDLAIPSKVPPREEDLGKLLVQAGFTEGKTIRLLPATSLEKSRPSTRSSLHLLLVALKLRRARLPG